jgi:hypothetical protein
MNGATADSAGYRARTLAASYAGGPSTSSSSTGAPRREEIRLETEPPPAGTVERVEDFD